MILLCAKLALSVSVWTAGVMVTGYIPATARQDRNSDLAGLLASDRTRAGTVSKIESFGSDVVPLLLNVDLKTTTSSRPIRFKSRIGRCLRSPKHSGGDSVPDQKHWPQTYSLCQLEPVAEAPRSDRGNLPGSGCAHQNWSHRRPGSGDRVTRTIDSGGPTCPHFRNLPD